VLWRTGPPFLNRMVSLITKAILFLIRKKMHDYELMPQIMKHKQQQIMQRVLWDFIKKGSMAFSR